LRFQEDTLHCCSVTVNYFHEKKKEKRVSLEHVWRYGGGRRLRILALVFCSETLHVM
jgi:hypothetical protein